MKQKILKKLKVILFKLCCNRNYLGIWFFSTLLILLYIINYTNAFKTFIRFFCDVIVTCKTAEVQDIVRKYYDPFGRAQHTVRSGKLITTWVACATFCHPHWIFITAFVFFSLENSNKYLQNNILYFI